MDIITKELPTRYVTAVSDGGIKETFVVPKRQYKYPDNSLLNYLNKQTDLNLVHIERKFIERTAYWITTEDFLNNAHRAIKTVYPNGGAYVHPEKGELEKYVAEKSKQAKDRKARQA